MAKRNKKVFVHDYVCVHRDCEDPETGKPYINRDVEGKPRWGKKFKCRNCGNEVRQTYSWIYKEGSVRTDPALMWRDEATGRWFHPGVSGNPLVGSEKTPPDISMRQMNAALRQENEALREQVKMLGG